MNIIESLKRISQSPWYWRAYIAGSLLLLIMALGFQYLFDEQPCVVCIQVRLLLTVLIIISIVRLLAANNKVMNLFAHVSVVLTAAVLTERSYLLLGTERGFIFADCGFSLGLPVWFDIEQWIPWLYRIETSCGYTPEILFGITMAEALMVMSVLLLLFSFCVFIASIISYKTKE